MFVRAAHPRKDLSGIERRWLYSTAA